MIFLTLFLTFMKIGAFTFGGGYAMLPLIQEEVLKNGWLELQQLVDFVAVSESTPGPFAVNISTYIGMTQGGLLGSACATLGVILPSFIVILIVAQFYEKFKTSKIVSGCMTGLRPAVIGLISSAVISIGKSVFFYTGVTVDVFKTVQFYISLALFLIMSVLAFKKIHPILIICISAVVGIIVGYTVGI